MPRLFITDRDGWMREFKLDKSLIYLGSDPRCDVVLDSARGSGIAARHAQLLASANRSGDRRLVNLSDVDVALGTAGEILPSRAATEIAPGMVFKLGEYTILMRGDDEPVLPMLVGGTLTRVGPLAIATPAGALSALPPAGGTGGLPAFVLARGGGSVSSDKIGMQVTLSSPILAPDLPIEGRVVVQNTGDEAGVQFRVEVSGLPLACYELGASPLLFPGATKDVAIRIIHPKGPSLPAGERSFTIRVTAPDAYPGEAAAASATVRVAPYFAHSALLRLRPQEVKA